MTNAFAVEATTAAPRGPLREFWGYFSANHGAVAGLVFIVAVLIVCVPLPEYTSGMILETTQADPPAHDAVVDPAVRLRRRHSPHRLGPVPGAGTTGRRN